MTTLAVQKQKDSPAAPIRRTTRNPLQLMRSLMHWDPFQEMSPILSQAELTYVPEFEVSESKDSYLFKADVPGVKDTDLNVTVTGNQLVISGKRSAEEMTHDQNYYLYERSYGSFSRSFTLPDTADMEKAKADLKDGVLTVVLPKRVEAQPRKLTVNLGTAAAAGPGK